MSQKKGAAVQGLPPNKRYIATHSPEGKSVYFDSPDQHFNGSPGVGGVARSYSLASLPATIGDSSDIQSYLAEDGPTSYTGRNIVSQLPTGANLLVIDLEPGAKSAMHRTVSVDFSICVMGEIEHELDGGETVRLRPGDHIVQRGTNHRWSNPSKDTPARFVAVTLPAKPFEIPGLGELKEVHIPSDEWDRKAKAEL